MESQIFNTAFSELVRQRYSCRTFSSRGIEPEKLDSLRRFLEKLESDAPFGNRIRLGLIPRKRLKTENPFTIGTYGLIKGVDVFIAGIIDRARDMNFETLGYCLEKAVIYAADLGINSCWIGGVFDRKTFGKIIKVKDDEILPAVIALGYGDSRRTLRDRMVRWGARGDSRLPFDRLFFDKTYGNPLYPSSHSNGGGTGSNERSPIIPGIFDILENIRLAPSASNKQPWRIIVDDGSLHFYLYRDKIYSKLIPRVDLQRIDMGIAMCHFQCSASEKDLDFNISVDPPEIENTPSLLEYIISYNIRR